MAMVTLRADAKFGYGGKQYICRITGRNSSYTFEREFVGRKEGKRGEDSVFETDEPGLYLCCDIDRKGNKEERFRVVLIDAGVPKIVYADKDEAMQIARAFDDGRALTDIVADVDFSLPMNERSFTIRTAAQAKRAAAGATVDSVIDHCWQVLQSLPEKEAKKVLSALRLKVSPPAPKLADLPPAAADPEANAEPTREEGDPDRLYAE